MSIEQIENNQDIVKESNLQKYLLIGLSVFALLLLLSLSYVVIALTNTKIYPDIKISNLNVSGLSKEQAKDKLNSHYIKAQSDILTITIAEKKETIRLKDLNISYDIDTVVNSAYSLGRQGNAFKRLIEIIKLDTSGKNLDVLATYDTKKVNSIIDEIENSILGDIKQHSYEVNGNILTFFYGHGGRGIDRSKLSKLIETSIKEGSAGDYTFEVENVEPSDFNIDSIPQKPKNAEFTIENNSSIKYVEEQYGILLDKEIFKRLYEKNLAAKQNFSISVELVKPEVCVEDLKQKVFADTLATFETYYGTSPANRKTNVQLAASKIDNYILGPGEEFSYNKVVGPRTIEKGFKLAHAYSNGKIIDDIGGGICQVSTTLYNAVLRADLELVERQNHMFTVSYVPAGMDATVNYGTIDFRFKNNTQYPIKIVNNTTPSNAKFIILGTNSNPQKTVDFRREILKTIPFSTKENLDPNLNQGKIVVDQNGANGYVVNVYKIIKENNNTLKEVFLNKSSYSPLNTIIRKGTKAAAKNSDSITGEPDKEVQNQEIQQQTNQIIDEIPLLDEPIIPAANNGEELPVLQ